MDILGLIALARSKGGGSGSGTFVPSFGTLATIQTGVSWFGDDPYTLTVLVSGYTVTDKTMISVLPSADVIEQMIADGVTNIFITNSNGTLTATAVGGAPTTAMTLQVLCSESDQVESISALPGIVGNGVLETLQATDLTDAINQLSSDLDDAKNAIDEKAPVIINTASGDIVTFDDGADGMPIKHLIANIEPVQAEGTPSPENPLPISGWTGLTGARNGINQWDEEVELGGISSSDGSEYSSKNALRAKNYIPVIPGEKYYFVCPVSVTRCFYDENKQWISTGYSGNAVITVPANAHYFRFSLATSYGTIYNHDISINYPSTDTAYEPYQGDTISVSWQSQAGTVYGGTLDVVTGELTVTKAYALLNNPDLWAKLPSTSTTPFQYQYSFDDKKLHNNSYTGLICSYYIVDSSDPTNTARWSGSSNLKFGIKSPTLTLDQIKADASAGKIAIRYDLATPIIYHLDPITVNTLLGNNTIYVDCGSVSVDYPADTGIVVAEQSNAISQKETKTTYTTLSGTTVTQTGEDHVMYLCGELATLSFTAPQTGITAIRFSSGTTATVYTLNGVQMPDDWPVTTQSGSSISGTLDANKTYEINVLDGKGVYASWS